MVVIKVRKDAANLARGVVKTNKGAITFGRGAVKINKGAVNFDRVLICIKMDSLTHLKMNALIQCIRVRALTKSTLVSFCLLENLNWDKS